MQKGSAVIFLLIGIVMLVVIGGAFYLGRSTISKPSPAPAVTFPTPLTPSSSPTSQNETANWNTYTNRKVGFSLSYPKDWTLEENALDSQPWTGTQISLQSPEDVKHNANPLADFGNGLFLYIYDNPKEMSLDDFIKEDRQITDPEMMKWNSYIIGSATARQYYLPRCCAGEDIFLGIDKYILYFADMTDPEIFKTILSTLKFL